MGNETEREGGKKKQSSRSRGLVVSFAMRYARMPVLIIVWFRFVIRAAAGTPSPLLVTITTHCYGKKG